MKGLPELAEKIDPAIIKIIREADIIPDDDQYSEYIQLSAGWNILVETGVSLGINLDKPQRARKIGNEYIEGQMMKKHFSGFLIN